VYKYIQYKYQLKDYSFSRKTTNNLLSIYNFGNMSQGRSHEYTRKKPLQCSLKPVTDTRLTVFIIRQIHMVKTDI